MSHNYRTAGPPSYQTHNLDNVRFIFTKIFRTSHEIMLHDMLSELSTTCITFTLPCNVCIGVTRRPIWAAWDELDQRVDVAVRQWRTHAHVKAKRRI